MNIMYNDKSECKMCNTVGVFRRISGNHFGDWCGGVYECKFCGEVLSNFSPEHKCKKKVKK